MIGLEVKELFEMFAVAFSQPTFNRALILMVGAILSPGRRTVAAALRVMGLKDDPHFSSYHQVLNRAQWSLLFLSRLLLGAILLTLPADFPIILLVDETLLRFASPWGRTSMGAQNLD